MSDNNNITGEAAAATAEESLFFFDAVDRPLGDNEYPIDGVFTTSMSSGMASASVSAIAAPSSATSVSSSSSVSISDLAPFVASVLRDKVVTDLMAESKQKDETIEQEREDRLRVELTGPRGVPVHCKRSMKDGFSFNKTTNREATSSWVVRFDFNIPNFIDTVAGLEIRVSGVVVLRLKEAVFLTGREEHFGFDRTRDDQLQMAKILFLSPDVKVVVRVGPILYENYINLLGPNRPITLSDFVRLLTDHRTNNPNNTVLLQELKLDLVHCCKHSIPGTMSVLQSMGLSTE